MLRLLCQRPPKYCTSSIIAQRLGTGPEEARALLSEFEKLQLVSELELDTENGDTKVYKLNTLGSLVPFLHAAYMMVVHYGNLSLIADKREAPLLRKKAQTKKEKQAGRDSI